MQWKRPLKVVPGADMQPWFCVMAYLCQRFVDFMIIPNNEIWHRYAAPSPHAAYLRQELYTCAKLVGESCAKLAPVGGVCGGASWLYCTLLYLIPRAA